VLQENLGHMAMGPWSICLTGKIKNKKIKNFGAYGI